MITKFIRIAGLGPSPDSLEVMVEKCHFFGLVIEVAGVPLGPQEWEELKDEVDLLMKEVKSNA